MRRTHIIFLIVLLVLILDQALKIWVKSNMYIGEDSFLHWSATPYWGRLHFVENDGMAFGLKLGGEYGKLALSLFRIVAVGFLIYFIRKLIQSKATMGLLVSFALILAGALGNILDSALYGMIFSASPVHSNIVAELLPDGGGYSSFLHGKVVDMLYFPMFNGTFPDWFPFWGEEPFEFFKPVFNIADMSISIGVISILLFQRSFFSSELDNTKEPTIEKLVSEENSKDRPSQEALDTIPSYEETSDSNEEEKIETTKKDMANIKEEIQDDDNLNKL